MSEQESPDDRPMIAYTGRTLPLESDECNLDGQADPAADPRGPRYTFGELLDQGGMGEVWQVFDSDLKRRVAMKLIHESLPGPAVRRRFVEEAQIAGQLDHPNIVPVYELGQTDSGRSYFTMKEVRGRSLADILDSLESGDEKTRTAFTLTRILQTMQKVCEAMSLAHARGIIHRDLKPSNIMLGAFGEVLVMDWGLALPLDVLDDDSGRQDILRRAEISDKIERIRRDAETTGQIFRAQDARLTMDGASLRSRLRASAKSCRRRRMSMPSGHVFTSC